MDVTQRRVGAQGNHELCSALPGAKLGLVFFMELRQVARNNLAQIQIRHLDEPDGCLENLCLAPGDRKTG